MYRGPAPAVPKIALARPEALPLLRALWRALGPDSPPCSEAPEAWWPVTAAGAERAIAGCQRCPALAACAAFAEVNRERAGVWGGEDLGRLDRSATNQEERTA